MKKQRDMLPDPKLVDVIDCGWMGCDARILYDRRMVKDHVRVSHGGLFRKGQHVTCRWVRADTGTECESVMYPGSLCRHTLDIHTNLLAKSCKCGNYFREDTFKRHKCGAMGNQEGST